MPPSELVLEAAALASAEWDERCVVLGGRPREKLAADIQAAVDVAVSGTTGMTVATVDEVVGRLVRLAFRVLARYAAESLRPPNDLTVRRTVKCFASVVRRWYGPARWQGEFVPKVGAFDLVMDFALMMGAPGLNTAYEDWVKEVFRKVAEDVADGVLQGYILDVVCHDAV